MVNSDPNTPAPFKEGRPWDSNPEEANAPHGFATDMPVVRGQAHRPQDGLDAVHLLPVRLSGACANVDPRTVVWDPESRGV